MTRMIECCHPKSERWTRREKIVRADERSDLLVYTFCGRCGHWLSLGEGNDADERVGIEMRAAEIAQEVSEMTEWWLYVGINSTDEENRGYSCAESNMGEHNAEWQAGYLARAITTHATDSGEPPPAGGE
jgi:hypothetical protein